MSARLSVQLAIVSESHKDFMKTVNADVERIKTSKRSDEAQGAVSTIVKIGTVLENIDPIISGLTSVSALAVGHCIQSNF